MVGYASGLGRLIVVTVTEIEVGPAGGALTGVFFYTPSVDYRERSRSFRVISYRFNDPPRSNRRIYSRTNRMRSELVRRLPAGGMARLATKIATTNNAQMTFP